MLDWLKEYVSKPLVQQACVAIVVFLLIAISKPVAENLGACPSDMKIHVEEIENLFAIGEYETANKKVNDLLILTNHNSPCIDELAAAIKFAYLSSLKEMNSAVDQSERTEQLRIECLQLAVRASKSVFATQRSTVYSSQCSALKTNGGR